MNDCPKQRYASANAFQGRIQEQPLSQDSFCDDSTDGQSLSPSSQAASIYEGTTKVSAVSEIAPTQKQPSSAISKPTSNTENWSTSLQAVLEQPPSTLPQKLLLGGIAFCVAFGAWAWLGKIEQVGYAQGQLVPKGQVYKIDPVDSGKITRIAVKEGEKVKAGQVLVEIDTQLAASEVERLQQMLTADRMQFNQMQALLERIRLEAETRVAIADADLQAQNAAISETKEKVATTQKLLTQLQSDLAAYKARQERIRPVVEQGAIAREQLFEAEQALRDRQRAITESQGELKQALAEANRLQAGLAQKQAEKRTTQLEAQQRIQQLEVEITQLKAKITETVNLMKSATTRLTQYFLRAPVSGFVSSLNVHNVGEVVQPGQTVAEMAPHKVPLVLSAVLPNREAGFVKRGMPVQVKFDAYPYQDFGIVPGKVISISPDAKPDERLGPVYKVEVALERNYITANNQTIEFKPGQTAAAEIVIRHRRIADVLLDPIKQIQKGGINL